METRITRLLGIDAPIVQAPIGSASNPELAAAVSNAGGLGSLALSWKPLEDVRDAVRQTRALSSKPFAANLVLEWDQTERLDAVLEEGAPIVSLFWGDCRPYVRAAHARGRLVGYTAGSLREASEAIESGVDFIVAQGVEAGGHVRGDVTTMVLVPQIRAAHPEVPLLAAGGIADGRGLAAALALGADGVWMGTRFLTSREARIHPEYRERLLASAAEDTVKTSVFDIGWEGAHRVLRNSTLTTWEMAGGGHPRPGEGEVVAYGEGDDPIVRYSFALPRPDVSGEIEAMAMYCGQSIGLIDNVISASEIVEQTVREARSILTALAGEGIS